MKDIKDLLKKKYFIFDIDGTVVDSMGMWNRVDQEIIYKKTGKLVDLMEIKAFRDSVIYNLVNVKGNIYLAFYKELINHYGIDMTVEEYDRIRSQMSGYISVNKLEYKAGAGEFIKILKDMGKKIGVGTTTTSAQYDIYENQNKKMQEIASLRDLVDVKVLCEDVEKKKPDPEVYLKVVEMFGCSPEECVVFEDSLNGIMAGKLAGIDVVSVYDDSSVDEMEKIKSVADYQIDSFTDLMDCLFPDQSDEKQ